MYGQLPGKLGLKICPPVVCVPGRDEIAVQYDIKKVLTVGIQTEALGPRHTRISGAVQKRDTHESELRIFGALALGVEGAEISLIVFVRCRDHGCGLHGPAILRPFRFVLKIKMNNLKIDRHTRVTTRLGVRISSILAGIVTALEGTIAAVDGVEEIVERCDYSAKSVKYPR
jgi:hypothetical protein